ERAQLGMQTLAAPERAADPYRLLQVRERLAVWHAMEVLDHQLAARAEPEDRPALRDLVQRGDAHREQAGRAAEDVRDAGRELQALGVERDLGEELELLVGPRLGNPDRVVAEIVGELRRAQHGLPVVALPERDDADALHRATIRRSDGAVKPRADRVSPWAGAAPSGGTG